MHPSATPTMHPSATPIFPWIGHIYYITGSPNDKIPALKNMIARWGISHDRVSQIIGNESFPAIERCKDFQNGDKQLHINKAFYTIFEMVGQLSEDHVYFIFEADAMEAKNISYNGAHSYPGTLIFFTLPSRKSRLSLFIQYPENPLNP